MRNIRFITALIGFVIALTVVQPVRALCESGHRVMAVQHSDIRLEPDAPSYMTVGMMSLDLPIPPGGPFAVDCGMLAKSEFPGLSIVSGYGNAPPVTNPPGIWTQIGIASGTAEGTQPWTQSLAANFEVFSIKFDGRARAGTQGRILLGVNQGGDVVPFIVPIGAINVYVGFPTPTATWFTVRSTVRNVSRDRVTLDHPLLNGNRGAKLFVSHVFNPPALLTPLQAKRWNHPIMTTYDDDLSRWVINNADGTAMPAGLSFNVRIDASASVFGSGNADFNPPVESVKIRDPIADGNPYAIIAVSMRGSRAVNAHPIAVQYRAPHWHIVNSDHALIPAGVQFNVRVIGFSAYQHGPPTDRLDRFVGNSAGVSVNDIGISAPQRLLHFWWQLGTRPTFPMLVTQNLTPEGKIASRNAKYLGLKYVAADKPRWAVINEDGSEIPSGAAFNVFAEAQPVIR